MAKTCEQLRKEIVEQLGFFPEFFDPAITDAYLLTELWRETVGAYLESPLPRCFKEKLFVYLSGYAHIPYRVLCHAESSSLIGLSSSEVLAMWDEQEAIFTANPEASLSQLKFSAPICTWPDPGTDLYEAILAAAFQLFAREPGYQTYQVELARVLGLSFYTGLIDFLSYMHHCKLWVESHPELNRHSKRTGGTVSPLGRHTPFLSTFWGAKKAPNGDAAPAPGPSEEMRVRLHAKANVNANVELLLSEKRFSEKIIDSSLDGILAYDTDFCYSLWNPAMEKMTGAKKENVLGKNCFDVFPHLKASGKDRILKQVLHGTSIIVRDQTYAVPGAKRDLFFEAHHSPLIDENGEIIGGLAILRDISDRKRAEEALRTTEYEYLAFCENAADIIFTGSVQGAFRTLNPAFETLTGWSREEWQGKFFLPLIHPLDVPKAMLALTKIANGEEIRNLEIRLKCKSGEYRNHEVFAFPQRKDGRVVGILGISRDITERRRIEDERVKLIRAEAAKTEAEASEYRYRQIAEAIPQIVWTADPNGKIDYGNQRWSEFTGTIAGSGLDNRWVFALHPEDRDKVIEDWGQAVSQGDNYRMECRFKRFDGAYRWHLLLAIPVRISDGPIIKWFGTATDIDEQKKVQEALKESEMRSRRLMEEVTKNENRYRMVAKATNDCIWDWDLTTNVVERNVGVKTSFGYLEEDVQKALGWWKENLHPEDRVRVTASLQDVIQNGKCNWLEEYRYLRADGRFAYVIDRGFVMYDEGSRPIRMVGAMIDVTDQKLAEEKLRRSNAELEQFAYVASHDLKEPLRMVNSYLQLLELRYAEKLDSDGLDFVNFAREGAARMYDLIDDLLAYSRIGAPELRKRIECRSSLEKAIANLETSIQETGAVIECYDLPTVLGERTQLIQLFQNLIANAIKFRREVTPRIEINAVRKGNNWVFSVRDNGIGIAPEFAQRIFIIFQRLHTRDKYSGTGIGLAICKKIVERHGGDIWVESEPGSGATFFFTLPVVVGE